MSQHLGQGTTTPDDHWVPRGGGGQTRKETDNAVRMVSDAHPIGVRNPLMGQPKRNLKCTWSAREAGYDSVTSL